MVPTQIQEMFGVVAKQVQDERKKKILFNTIRKMIYYKRYDVPDRNKLSTLFEQREELKEKILRVHDVPAVQQENADHVDEVFKLAGFLQPNNSVAHVPIRAPSKTLEITAEGYEKIVVHLGNGKKIVLDV